MLEARSISRRYGAPLAVDDVSFTVRPGEVVGLLGHNGAGKSTIMKLLSGTLEPDVGEVLLDGRTVHDDPTRLQRRLGYLPEYLPLYPELTVASYLDYAAGLKGLAGAARRRSLREAIEATELGERLLSPVATLSRGLEQRVGVAQALLGAPSLLILDEPTNGLDPQQTERMRALVRRIAEAATVILSTHIMQEVEAVCDRALIVRAGRLAVDARLDELTGGRALRLDTRTAPETVRAALDGVSDIATAEPFASTATAHDTDNLSNAPGGVASDTGGGKSTRWMLALSDTALAEGAGAAIARLVPILVAAGVEINAIAPDARDLQSLFLDADATGAGEAGVDTRAEVADVA